LCILLFYRGEQNDDYYLLYGLLRERARWSYLARSGLPAISRKKAGYGESHIINLLLKSFIESHICNKSFIDHACPVKVA